MKNMKREVIYYGEDRSFPLNQMRQDLVDDWLNESENADCLLQYELYVLEKVNEAKNRGD